MDLETFAARLKALREAAGLTQKQLADKAALSQRAVSAWEQADREPGILAVCALAQALNVDVGVLLAEAEPPKKPRKGKGAK